MTGPSRFAGFTQAERDVLHDGLMGEAKINPHEDPTFPAIVATAESLLAELGTIRSMSDWGPTGDVQ